MEYRITKESAQQLWEMMSAEGGMEKIRNCFRKILAEHVISSSDISKDGKHSDAVIAVDSDGNICSMIHSANCFFLFIFILFIFYLFIIYLYIIYLIYFYLFIFIYLFVYLLSYLFHLFSFFFFFFLLFYCLIFLFYFYYYLFNFIGLFILFIKL